MNGKPQILAMFAAFCLSAQAQAQVQFRPQPVPSYPPQVRTAQPRYSPQPRPYQQQPQYVPTTPGGFVSGNPSPLDVMIEAFDWILYVFGAFLLITAFRVARHKEAEVHPENNFVLKLVRRVVPSTPEYDGQKMFTRRTGKLLATPLFAVLILVETTDVVFAVDSIPAILAVSREPFIVFASNAFAILGLRALYFLLAGMADRFRYLNIGLGVILAFVGIKMIMVEVYHMPTYVSLGVIALVLTITIVASLRAEKRDALRAADADSDPPSSGPPAPSADGPTDGQADGPTDGQAGSEPAASSQPADVDP
jgi:predicted tellurium resistance membrane protein TerC